MNPAYPEDYHAFHADCSHFTEASGFHYVCPCCRQNLSREQILETGAVLLPLQAGDFQGELALGRQMAAGNGFEFPGSVENDMLVLPNGRAVLVWVCVESASAGSAGRVRPSNVFRLVRAPTRRALHAALGEAVRNEERIANFEVEVQRQDGGTLMVPWRDVHFFAREPERIWNGSGGWGPEGLRTELPVLSVLPSVQVAQSNQTDIQALPPMLENSSPSGDATEVLEMQEDTPLGPEPCAEEGWHIYVRALGLSDRVVRWRLPERTVLASVLSLGIHELALDPPRLASWNLLRDSVNLRGGGQASTNLLRWRGYMMALFWTSLRLGGRAMPTC